jgi:thiol-disulfide isomerase/thioredoxin
MLAALAVATAFGLYWRSRNGRVVRLDCPAGANQATAAKTVIGEPTTVAGGQPPPAPNPATATDSQANAVPGSSGARARAAGISATDGKPAAGGELSAADLGAPLGSRATLVQFSSAFCAPCRATRRILADVADLTDGVTHVEVDAESRLDLVRRLGVRRTPTTLILGPDGLVTHRASGQPRKADVIAAVGAVV